MTVLVTGASGFIGRRFIKYLDRVARPYVAQTRNTSNSEGFWVCDLTKIITDLPRGIDTVVHLAATSPMATETVASNMIDNVTATYNLVEACKEATVNKFIFASSVDCYGDVEVDVIDEHTQIRHIDRKSGDFYAWSKIGCEYLLSQNTLPFSTLLIRLPGVVGSNCGNTWLKRVADKLINHSPISLYNLDSMFNNTLHVDDLCQFLVSCLDLEWKSKNDLITIASNEPMPIITIVEYMKEKLASSSQLLTIDPIKRPFTISFSKAEKKYGYTPGTIRSLLDRFLDDQTSRR